MDAPPGPPQPTRVSLSEPIEKLRDALRHNVESEQAIRFVLEKYDEKHSPVERNNYENALNAVVAERIMLEDHLNVTDRQAPVATASPSQQTSPPVSHAPHAQSLPPLASHALVAPSTAPLTPSTAPPLSPDFCYRALRTDESPDKGLFAKDPTSTATVRDHILHGSERSFKSPFISVTIELRIAVAFSGPFQEIAAIRWSAWKEKTKAEVINFASTDNRDLLLKDDESERAIANVMYARRSQEMLLRKQVPAEYVKGLKKSFKLTNPPHLLPNCAAISRFPQSDTDISTIKLIEMVGDTNDGMFRLSWRDTKNVEHKLIYKKARPNVADEIPDAKRLQQHLRREFLALTLYRRLGHCVPDCCLYEGSIYILDGEGHERIFPFSFLLCEDNPSVPLPPTEAAIHRLASAFVLDCLVGNWRLFGFTVEDRLRHIVVIVNDGKSFARRSAESAFGLVYQDDRQKKRSIIEWRNTSVPELDQLRKLQPWVYGHLSDEDIAQQIASMFQSGLEKIIQEVFSCETDICEQLLKRAFWLQQRLNWFPLPLASKECPCARDGHTAVIVGSGDNRRMIIFGGSTGDKSEGTPIGDVWSLNLKTHVWSCIDSSRQQLARYSHTATLWKDRYMVVIGGAFGTNRFFNDIQVFDCDQNRWLQCRNNTSPNVVFPKIARHAAVLYNSNFILVYGGSPEQRGQKKKYEVLDSLYSVKLAFGKNPTAEVVEYNWMLRKATEGQQHPNGMHRHNLVNVGKKVYLISKEASKVIWRLDPSSISWDRLSVAQPCVRRENLSGDVVVALGRTLISIGGAIKFRGATSSVDTDQPANFGGHFANVKAVPECVVYTCNLDTQEWSKPILVFGDQPKPRTSASACVVDNKVIVFGGMVDTGPTRLNDVWVFRLGPPSQDIEELEQKTHELLSEFARRNPSMLNCEEHLRQILAALRKAK